MTIKFMMNAASDGRIAAEILDLEQAEAKRDEAHHRTMAAAEAAINEMRARRLGR